MSRRHDRPTFAEMVRQPTWSEQEASTTGRHAVRPGTYNQAGELFDPEGAPLRKVRDDVTADDARRLLVEGARLVHESCGCGGHGGCPPRWFEATEVSAVLADERAAWVHDEDEGGWADVWAGAAGEVVYAHGEIAWLPEQG